MNRKRTYTVFGINGESAVKLAKRFQGGYCYRGIYNHGKRIAQLEVVLDEPGEYNGYPNKWVEISVIGRAENETLSQLKKIGFSDEWILISTAHERGCMCEMESHAWTKL